MWQLLPLAETHLERGSRKQFVPSPYKGYGVGLSPRWLPREHSQMTPKAGELAAFVKENGDWLLDYALFCALRDEFNTDNWTVWPAPIRRRRPQAVTEWQERLSEAVDHHVLVQWQLSVAYGSVREEAGRRKISMVGDLPYYVPLQSPLVWSNQEAFRIGRGGRLTWQSGIPKHASGHFGRQTWGHPLYNWKNYAAVMRTWKIRLDNFARMYDLIRIDHPKGFFRYGAMHVTDSSKDKLSGGPGSKALLEVVRRARSHGMEVMAEDAGYRLGDLRKVLDTGKVAGVRILRFAYNEKQKRIVPRYADVNKYPGHVVAYPSTHDTESLVGYLKKLSAAERRLVSQRIGVEYSTDVKELAKRFIQSLLASKSHCVIVPLRDWLGSSARINVPGTEKPIGDRNWRYKTEIPIEEFPDLKGYCR